MSGKTPNEPATVLCSICSALKPRVDDAHTFNVAAAGGRVVFVACAECRSSVQTAMDEQVFTSITPMIMQDASKRGESLIEAARKYFREVDAITRRQKIGLVREGDR